MKFRYLGKNEVMSLFGHDFSGGKTPDVTDDKAISRLLGNSHFAAIAEEIKLPPLAEILPKVKKSATVTALEMLSEGEDRPEVIDAIENKKSELLSKAQ